MARLAFVVNNPDFLLSHRRVLAQGVLARGDEVHVIAPPGPGTSELQRLGFITHDWALDRKGQHAALESVTLARLVRLYARVRPDLVHHVTIKPVLYGSFAARVTGVRAVVNAVSGLGFVFLAEGLRAQLRRRAIVTAYRQALGTKNSAVILQNDDDERELREAGALERATVVTIRGSGVDLSAFTPTPEPTGTPVVVLPARLLRDKGVLEFVEAARVLKQARTNVRMVLVGGLDAGNPAAITQQQLDGWLAESLVEWWGHRTDMPAVYAQANIVCLPSYREGMPKALLEAAAAGGAIVTTDVPGCRDAVGQGRAGVLVPARDATALVRAIGRLQSPERAPLSMAARALAVEQFDEGEVLKRHLEVYDALLHRASR